MRTFLFFIVFTVASASYASSDLAGCDCETGEGFSNKACKTSCLNASEKSSDEEDSNND